MDKASSKGSAEQGLFAGEAWFDPIEVGLRGRIRGLIEELVEQELEAALGRGRYERAGGAVGHRHGHRTRRLTGSFGSVEIAVPRARLVAEDGGTEEWRSAVLPRYARRTRQLEALIAGAYLAGTNTRRVQRALAALFRGAVGKDVVSRAWRKVKADWDAWGRRDLAGEDIVRLVLDGTVVRAVLDDLVARGLRPPEFLITDGAAGLEKALAALWPAVPAQRCTVHKHRNLLAHAPERLHEEISADYTDMIYAETTKEIETRRRAFLRKWRLKCRAVADSLEEAGEALFAFARLPPSQWKSARTTNAIERLHEEFKRRVKTQTALPSAETAAMLFWALLASGQISMRKVDGWQSLGQPPAKSSIDLAA